MSIALGEAIRKRREDIGLSQVKLGPVAGVSHGTVRNAESGKSLTTDSRRKIERALGWLPDSKEPFVEAGTMADLVLGLLARDEGGDGFDFRKARNVFHAFIEGVTAGTVSPELVDELVKEVTNHIPRARADAALAELGRAMDVRLGTSAGAGSGSVTVSDSAGVTDSVSVAFARHPTVGLPAMQAEMKGTVPDHERVIIKAGLISITPTMSLLAAMIPLPAEMVRDLTEEDINWVVEVLTKQGQEMANVIVQTKRRERSKQE